ncbi:MAG: class I SAM-dependent methyltransferase [Solirubrobacteraceae bacterium]
MLERLAAPAGRDVVDVGCGDGSLVRRLAASGARVTGVEISDEQLRRAIEADGGAGATYLVGRAQELPLADGSVDLVVFMRTLHHVEPAQLMSALTEARRVLRGGGAGYVAEPLAEGDYFELTCLVDDEREVRRAAQQALTRANEAGLRRRETVDYDVRVQVAGISGLRERIVSVDPARSEPFDACLAAIERAYERLGESGEPGEAPGTRSFTQPMRADLLARA